MFLPVFPDTTEPRWLHMSGYGQDGIQTILPAFTATSCLTLCLNSDIYKSVNYKMSTSTCTAAEISRASLESNLIANADMVYFELYRPGKYDSCMSAPFNQCM